MRKQSWTALAFLALFGFYLSTIPSWGCGNPKANSNNTDNSNNTNQGEPSKQESTQEANQEATAQESPTAADGGTNKE